MTEPITLAFVDTETTGLRPDLGHGVWEVATVVREQDGGESEYLWQIRPDLEHADPVALAKGRFDERFEVPDGCEALHFPGGGQEPFKVTAACAAGDIARVLDGAYLVGAVPSFDAMMLTALLCAHGVEPSWRYRLVCVENLVAGRLGRPVPQGLRCAATALGIVVDEDSRHTAVGDAHLAKAVYDASQAAAGVSDSVLVRRADLAAYLNRSTGDLRDEVEALNRLLAAAGIE